MTEIPETVNNNQNLDEIPIPASIPIPAAALIPIPSAPPIKPQKMIETTAQVETPAEIKIFKRNKPKTELEMKIMNAQGEHPSKKKDIFKAIFDSDSESGSDSDDEENSNEKSNADIMASLSKPSTSSMAMYAHLPDDAFKPKSAKDMNILRNTSPPRGIFSSLAKKLEQTAKSKAAEIHEKVPMEDAPDTYGPSLPPQILRSNSNKVEPKQSQPAKATKNTSTSVASISLGKNSDYKVVYEEKWIEKSDDKEKKSKKEKKHKKDRDRHKSKKNKKEKHKKKKR